MKFVKLSVIALSLGLFVASCGGGESTTPAADTTAAAPAAPATEPAPAAPTTTDSAAAPAADTAAKAAAPAGH